MLRRWLAGAVDAQCSTASATVAPWCAPFGGRCHRGRAAAPQRFLAIRAWALEEGLGTGLGPKRLVWCGVVWC